MAKRNRDLERLDREEAVRKTIIKIAAAVVGVIVLILLIVASIRKMRAAELKKQEEQAAAEEAARIEAEAAAKAAEEANDYEEIVFPSDASYTEKVTILGTGDNLIHESLYKDAETEEGYDFKPMYEHIKEAVSSADIATLNQETPLADAVAPISGYPKFNSPHEVGNALADAGFDVINEGNNHVMDQGVDGLLATLDFWDSIGVPYVGAYRDMDDLLKRRIIEVNGIKVAFLGFVEDVNEAIPSDSGVQIVHFYDEDMIEDLIKDAKSNADLVVVHAHWGNEDEDVISEAMQVYSRKMVDWGADIIFGNHTHILQNLEILKRESDGKLCPVIYSLGNFVSGQQKREQLLSGLMTVTCGKNPETGDTRVEGISFRPVVTHYEGDRENVTIYPVDEYNDDLCWENGVKTDDYPLTMDFLWDAVNKHISKQFLDAKSRAAYETYVKNKELKAAEEAAAQAEAETKAEGEKLSLLVEPEEDGEA